MDNNTCLRCGAPHEPDATVCLSCGAPIGETESPTQPVRAIKIPRPAETETATTPATPLPAPVSDARQAGISAGRPHDPIAASKIAPSRRWPLILIAGVLLLLLVSGTAYVAHVLTEGPQVAHQALYQDPQHRFHLQRPSLWNVTSSRDSVFLSDGTSTVNITISTPTGADDAKSFADTLAGQRGLGVAPAQVISGTLWEHRSGQATGADSVVREDDIYVTLHAGQLYTIECTSPITSFSGTNNLVFQPLLASFTFD